MMKRMKKAISFIMAVCLLAGSSYVNAEATTSVSMSEWTQVGNENVEKPAEPLLQKGMFSYLQNKDTETVDISVNI